MAANVRFQSGKEKSGLSTNRGPAVNIKSADFLAAKRREEEAFMTALGMKPIPQAPPPATPGSSTQRTPVTKSDRESTSIKNEPMTPAVHNNSHGSTQKHQSKSRDSQRKEDRRRRRQLKAAGSDEDKHDWSDDDDDEDDVMDNVEEDDNNQKLRQSIQGNKMTEKELDEFLIDLVKNHGLKSIKRCLKSKDGKEEQKRKRSPSLSDAEKDKSKSKHKHKKKHEDKEESKSKKSHKSRSSSPSSSSSDSERDKSQSKHKHKKKHDHKDKSKSKKSRKTRSSSPSSDRDRSKRDHDR